MAITMSMADRRIAITENHILRFYADALYLGIGILQKRFLAISGVPLPEPGDPSREDWWNELDESAAGAADTPNSASPKAASDEAMGEAAVTVAGRRAEKIRQAYSLMREAP